MCRLSEIFIERRYHHFPMMFVEIGENNCEQHCKNAIVPYVY